MTRPSSDEPIFSIRNGIFMPFVYKGHQIVVHNSSWTFRETIWVDDDVVFSAMGYRFKSTQVIVVAGDRLELTYGIRNAYSEFFLQVRRDGELIHDSSHSPYGGRSRYGKWPIILSALLGGVLGYFVAKFAIGLFV